MQTEIEAKFLNVNHDVLRDRLTKAGATLEKPMRLMKRTNFDFPDGRLDNISGWVRVRDEEDKITLTYKQLNDRTLHGTKEVEVVVGDMADAQAFLKAIGLEQKTYQETRRESWRLDDVFIELDEWPWVKPFIELEAASEAALRQVAEKLGLDWEKAMHGSVETVYQSEYNVTEAEVDAFDDLVFKPVPEWLSARRKSGNEASV